MGLIYQVLHEVENVKPDLSFLELGNGEGKNFDKVPLLDKTTVDYAVSSQTGEQYEMTTDVFFADKCNRDYDVIYIDAGHKMPWPVKDYICAINFIKNGGLIVIHDLYPAKRDLAYCDNGYQLLNHFIKINQNIIVGPHEDFGITAIFPPFKPFALYEIEEISYNNFCKKNTRLKIHDEFEWKNIVKDHILTTGENRGI